MCFLKFPLAFTITRTDWSPLAKLSFQCPFGIIWIVCLLGIRQNPRIFVRHLFSKILLPQSDADLFPKRLLPAKNWGIRSRPRHTSKYLVEGLVAGVTGETSVRDESSIGRNGHISYIQVFFQLLILVWHKIHTNCQVCVEELFVTKYGNLYWPSVEPPRSREPCKSRRCSKEISPPASLICSG